MKDMCGTTGLACIRCNPSACEHRECGSGFRIIDKLNHHMIKHKVTIRATANERLIITDEVSGEEYVVDNLGYPF